MVKYWKYSCWQCHYKETCDCLPKGVHCNKEGILYAFCGVCGVEVELETIYK